MSRIAERLPDGGVDISQPAPLNAYPSYAPKARKEITEEERTIARAFGMPDAALDLIDFFFTPADRELILALAREGVSQFPATRLDDGYREDAFRRGVLSKADESGETWTLNDFYGLLDLFSVTQTYRYRTLTRQKRRELDDWYFKTYCERLDPDLTKAPTSDRVLTLEELLAFLDREERPMYLACCDCRSLSGDCALPSRTCINLVQGPNGFAARGASERIDRETAKEIVRKADAAGLIHTVSDHGVCNCCGDCCYLFRAQKARRSQGLWPASPHVVSADGSRCVRCGKCQSRCHFGVFRLEGRGKEAVLRFDGGACVGCGLCVSTCPTGALSLVERAVLKT